jgi:hypothetical protein
MTKFKGRITERGNAWSNTHNKLREINIKLMSMADVKQSSNGEKTSLR